MDLDAKSNKGDSPIVWALVNSDETLAHALIDAGCDIHVKSSAGDGLLKLARWKGLTSIEQKLIKKGCQN